MSKNTQKLMGKGKPKLDPQGRREDEPQSDTAGLSQDEQNALKKIQKGAADRGSFLTHEGKGGLRPSLVLYVMKRDGFKCKVCGEYGDKDKNGGIGVHHRYQHITAPKERHKGVLANRQGRRNDPSELTTICERCHNHVHERDRAEYGGEDADDVSEDEG